MPSTSRPKGFRRIERWLVGLTMALVAAVLERIVMRSIRSKGNPTAEPTPTTLTSRGGDVDVG
jgi:hypothetical protein